MGKDSKLGHQLASHLKKRIKKKKDEIEALKVGCKAGANSKQSRNQKRHLMKRLEQQMSDLKEASINSKATQMELQKLCSSKSPKCKRKSKMLEGARAYIEGIGVDLESGLSKKSEKSEKIHKASPDKSESGYSPLFIERNRCLECNSKLFLNHKEAILSCIQCGLTQPNTSSVKNGPRPVNSRSRYNRLSVCKKSTRQWTKQGPKITKAIMNLVLNHMFGMRTVMNDRMRESAVREIIQKYGPNNMLHSVPKLCKKLRDDKIPEFDDKLADEICERFDAVLSQKLTQNNRKILNIEYLTRQFLMGEGREDLAACFPNHKTAQVVQSADRDMLKVFSSILSAMQDSVAPQEGSAAPPEGALKGKNRKSESQTPRKKWALFKSY